MYKAAITHTTSRRAALGLAAAALVTAAKPAELYGDDADIIALCRRLVENEGRLDAMHAIRVTPAGVNRTEDEYIQLCACKDALLAALDVAPDPRSPAGIAALARAGLRLRWDYDDAGSAITVDESHALLMRACAAMVDAGGVA